MPRIFTTPVMSGYAYSGCSSAEYKETVCNSIMTNSRPYAECLQAIRQCMLELRNTFGELLGLDGAFEENVSRIDDFVGCIDTESSRDADPTAQEQILDDLIPKLYDMLYDCITADCNRDVEQFTPGLMGRRTHLQIAKACAIIVNVIAIVNCCARTVATRFTGAVSSERRDGSASHTVTALSAYCYVKFSALSRCLNSSLDSEETENIKAILRVVRHNIELCSKVAELVEHSTPRCFRHRTEACLDSVIDAVETSAAACEAMVRNNESARLRLGLSRKAMANFRYYLEAYEGLGVHSFYLRLKQEGYTGALVHAVGGLFLMYRVYASTGNVDHVVAGRIGHCLRILCALYSRRRESGVYRARKSFLDMCSVYEEINENITEGALLRPQIEVKWRKTVLRYLSVMMNICNKKYGRYFNAVEQTGAAPSQPSTSGLGSTSAGVGGPQASSVPLRVLERIPIPYGAPWDQPSTSGLGSASAGVGGSQASYMPPHYPGSTPYSYAQPSTSGLGGTGSRVGGPQASSVPLRVLERIPIPYGAPWDQPSTSGMGGTAGTGSQQASHIPPHDPGMMPYSYAQPSTSWDQPSTSGLGSASAGVGGSQASYMPPHYPGSTPYSYAQPSTSGLGGTGSRVGGPQASSVPLRVLERIPIPYGAPWDQPSTSGMGGTAGTGSQQASHIPPHDQGIMPYSYAQPSTSWDQPSISGLGSASSMLEEAQVSSHRPRTPSDDSEPPSKQARRA
ncbi:putative hGE-14 protein [Anaplasma phagocytophilum str. CRT53-1]|uniref:Putative hGE-14 protein n=1 Tax=Anaplasma phagocytophilum str. CRT53-1 TaxID=1359157 RepID=A0A0F3Q429_ANAPH|nr:putative hGE-14 protein [Anaplasma phagocytophilum str. CRT53-1]